MTLVVTALCLLSPLMSSDNFDTRPAKRRRMDSDNDSNTVTKCSATPSSSQPLSTLTTLPTAVLLVSLPGLLIHPATHKNHANSLCVSLLAIRKCLSLPNLGPDIECRAWTALAEIGMSVIGAGFSQSEDHYWASGIEFEVCILVSTIHHVLRNALGRKGNQ